MECLSREDNFNRGPPLAPLALAFTTPTVPGASSLHSTYISHWALTSRVLLCYHALQTDNSSNVTSCRFTERLPSCLFSYIEDFCAGHSSRCQTTSSSLRFGWNICKCIGMSLSVLSQARLRRQPCRFTRLMVPCLVYCSSKVVCSRNHVEISHSSLRCLQKRSQTSYHPYCSDLDPWRQISNRPRATEAYGGIGQGGHCQEFLENTRRQQQIRYIGGCM